MPVMPVWPVLDLLMGSSHESSWLLGIVPLAVMCTLTLQSYAIYCLCHIWDSPLGMLLVPTIDLGMMSCRARLLPFLSHAACNNVVSVCAVLCHAGSNRILPRHSMLTHHAFM